VKNKKLIVFFFALSMFFTGASGLVNEYVLSTVSTYILGNSIEQFSITIAVMLGFMGLGGFVQKFISDRNLISKFLTLEFSLAIFGGFAPLAIYASFVYFEDHFILIQYFFISIIGFLVGFEIPFIIRINESYSDNLKKNLSVIMSADYIGSLVGAFVWVYLLLPYIPLTKISFIISGVNLVVAIITVLYLERNWKTYLFSFIAVALLSVGYAYSDKISINLEQKLYKDKVLYSTTTKYQHLVITKNSKVNDIRLYINGNTQFSSLDENIYHENLVHPIMSLVKNHKNVLVLGGGDGMAVREIKKYNDVNSISLIDLDPAMVQLAKTNPILSKLNHHSFDNVKVYKPSFLVDSDERKDIFKDKKYLASVNVYHIDADKMLHNIMNKGIKWDVIIIDFPDPSTVELAKLYSREFYLKIKKILAPGGMFVVQSTSPYHAKESYLCIGRTIQAAGFDTLAYHDNVPSFGDWGWWIGWNPDDKRDISHDINHIKFDINTTYLTENKFKSNTFFGKGWLTAKHNDINTLMFPKLLDLYTKNSWLYY